MTTATANPLTAQENAFLEALTTIDEVDEFDEFIEALSTARAMDASPMNYLLMSIIVDRISNFGDHCGYLPRNENELGENAKRVREILGLVTEEEDDYEVAFEDPKNCVYSLVYGLQHQYFWGEYDAPDVEDIDTLFEQLKEMEASGTRLVSFIYWNLLEPWMEYIDEGIEQGDEPCDDYKEWCAIVVKIKKME